MKWRNIILTIVIVALVGLGGAWAFRPQPLGVDLAEITSGTLSVTVGDEGVAQIKDTYEVSTPLGGDVERIPFTVGDLIREGQVVATIVPQLSSFLDERSRAEAEAAVKAAEAAVASARTDIDAAKNAVAFQKAELERTMHLRERGLVTEQVAEQVQFELDRRQSALTNAEASLDLRQRQLEQAEVRLIEPTSMDRRTIQFEVKAPADGQVLEIANENARALPAGSKLMTIGDPHNLDILVDLVSSDAVRVEAGDRATIEGWGGDTVLEARVRRVEPIGFTKVSALGIEEQRVRVRLDLTSPPELWRSLGHLYRVFAEIEVERYDIATLVPTSALFRSNNDWACYVAEGEVARLKTLTLGARDNGFAVVEVGLEPGERVIVHPSDQIVDGSFIADRATMNAG
ncbi:MAG: HlyD family efflux transporter periplasmic adaptor subunit [Alphaproteobacteria bacterium]|nr:HlyD family efflux transporter periplasmic adaptor subunit [Alphaproteobacteria bacterium]